MQHYERFYIDGEWVEPLTPGYSEIIDPTTEEVFASVAMGGVADVDRAVAAARTAFESYSKTTLDERIALIDRIIDAYEERLDDFSAVIAQEVGIPVSARAQVMGPIGHMKVARDLLKTYSFESRIGTTIIRREPIGVCALISPWNWPIQTKVIKVIYALAAGCTVVSKPSVNSPISAILLAEVLHKAGVPKGVFNLINGPGQIGRASCRERVSRLV